MIEASEFGRWLSARKIYCGPMPSQPAWLAEVSAASVPKNAAERTYLHASADLVDAPVDQLYRKLAAGQELVECLLWDEPLWRSLTGLGPHPGTVARRAQARLRAHLKMGALDARLLDLRGRASLLVLRVPI